MNYGTQLYQISSGLEGREIGRNGSIIESKTENMQKELREAWMTVRGEDAD